MLGSQERCSCYTERGLCANSTVVRCGAIVAENDDDHGIYSLFQILGAYGVASSRRETHYRSLHCQRPIPGISASSADRTVMREI